jgi:CheY-like chemotaxis protein
MELNPWRWQFEEQPNGDGCAVNIAHPPTSTSGERALSADAGPGQRGPPLRVLVVEDYADGGESLARLLALYGHEVEIARDGATAFRKAQERLPNVLLMDIDLPGEDGYAVAKRLRGLLPARPLLIAITGYGQPKDHQRSRDEGFDYHLVKPADPCELEGLLEKFIVRSRCGQGLTGFEQEYVVGNTASGGRPG